MMNFALRTISILIIFLPIVNEEVLAQQESKQPEKDPAGAVILTDVVCFAPSLVMLLGIHELGHATFASLAGAYDVKIGLYKRKPNGGVMIGWAEWRGNLSSFETALADGGGVIFSRGLAEGSHLLVTNISLPSWGQRFFSMTFLMSRIDFPRYVLQDALLNLFDRKGSDFDGVVTAIAGRDTGPRTWTYAAFLCIASVDLAFDWDRIVLHWKSLTGQPILSAEPQTSSNVQVRPFFDPHQYGLSLHATW